MSRLQFRSSVGFGTGLAAMLVIIGLMGAAVLSGTSSTTSGTPYGSTSSQLRPMTVPQALDAITGASLTSTDLFEVEGWLVQPVPADLVCPGSTVSSQFDTGCGNNKLRIGETPNGNPELAVAVLPGTRIPDALQKWTEPTPIVVVGHVHDLRASLCEQSALAGCESAFVLDQVVSFDSKPFGPSISIVSAGLQPTMSADQVSAAVGKVLQSGSTIVSITAVTLLDAWSYSPGLAPNGEGSMALWYVRVAGPPATLFPMPGSHPGSGILVLAEADSLGSAGVRGAAGWGWDPRKAGVVMPDGTISITTTNWLPGGGCRGVGVAEILHGSRDDPRVVWLENAPRPSWASQYSSDPSAAKLTVLWPAGYRARFTPKMEIVDGSDNVVLRDGDLIAGACSEDPQTNTLYLEPPFR